MVGFSQTMYAVLLLATSLTTVYATPTAASTAAPPFPLANNTQIPQNTTFLTSVTAAPTLPEFASRVRDGSISARDFRDQWPTSLGGPDCILDHDPRCFCCQWHHPARPAACGKLKCCPCIKQTCDAKDPNCKGNWE